MSLRSSFFWCTAPLLAVVAVTALPAFGQSVRVDAFVGEPFGVGRMELELPPADMPQPLGVDGLGLEERDGRVLYPALGPHSNAGAVVSDLLQSTPLMQGGPVRRQIGGLLRDVLNRPPKIELFFLFRGDQPVHLSLLAERPVSGPVRPRRDPYAHSRLLADWWKAYSASSDGLFDSKPAYPPLVENYLLANLARRLSLKLPEKKQTPSWQEELEQSLGLTLGTESIRVGMMQDRILGLNHLHLPADLPLPHALRPIRDESFEVPPGVEVEPIAMRVPEECVYVRFGSYANLLWFQDTMARWGGDIQNLAYSRGLNYDLNKRFEQRLAVKQTALARMFGEAVIADVAIIGADLFFREGAAFGMLFQAKQPAMLQTSLGMARSELVRAGTAKEETVEIDGKKVPFLHSPDGKVRSYLVADGNFFLATSSLAMARRFLETGKETGALGALPEFRLARAEMPLARNDTIFVYASQAFFENLSSPRYRVEMARRLQAHADIELVQLAVLAAAAEGKPGATIEQLKAGRLLPPEFGPRPDGSETMLSADGKVWDSLRGQYGAFLPVPDTPVDMITQAEASAIERFQALLVEQWGGRFDPLMVAIGREMLEDKIERVTIDAKAKPFASEHFQSLRRVVGAADTTRLAPVPGNVVAGEVQLKKQLLFWGIRDVGPPPSSVAGNLVSFGWLRNFVVGYLGTAGELGPLAQLHMQLGPPGSAGEALSQRLGLWRRQLGPFTVFSFQPQVLDEVMPQLQFIEAEYPAQLRLEVADPHAPHMTGFVNNLIYRRTREASLSNLRLFHQLQQQLHVPPASCREAAEFLLGAKVYCSLGGKYELVDHGGIERWTSTELSGGVVENPLRIQAPPGYTAPPLQWLRGLQLNAQMHPTMVEAHAEVFMDTNVTLQKPPE